MYDMSNSGILNTNLDIQAITNLIAAHISARGNKKFRRLYCMFYKSNSLILKVLNSSFAEEIFINNTSNSQISSDNKMAFVQNDFQLILQNVNENDLVFIIPPQPDELNEDTEVSSHQQKDAKTTLQRDLEVFIGELDKKQTTFIMFYGQLDKKNEYPIYCQWGHTIFLSRLIDGSAPHESLHHLYLSRNLARLAMTPDHYGKTIQPLFYRIVEVQAAQNPNRVAVICEHYSLSYKELNNAANQFARLLLNSGIDEFQKKCAAKNKDCVIAIALDRDDPQLLIAKLAIEKIGATKTLFNTVISRFPISKCIKRLIKSEVSYIITYDDYFQQIMNAAEASTFKSKHDLQLIKANRNDIAYRTNFTDLSLDSASDMQNLNRNISAQHILTHAYTSGSTGEPKGARIAARGYSFAVIAHIDAGRLGFDTKTVQFSSVDFDASELEEKMTLAAGGSLILINQAVYLDHIKLMQTIEKYQINCLTVTPKLLSLLLTLGKFPYMQFVLVVGENVNKELLDRLRDKLAKYKKPFYILVGYGTTQTTIQGTYLIYEKDKPLTVGYPALGVNVVMLPLNRLASVVNTRDHFTTQIIEELSAAFLKPQVTEQENPEEGLICTYGPCNMVGYVGGESVSQEILYNTKDIGYLLHSGIKIKGRLGRVVKINGQSVDLTDLENTLKEYNSLVKDCRAVAHQRNVQNTDVNVLAIYIVPESSKLIVKDRSSPSRMSLEALRKLHAFLREKLPIWYVPALVNMIFVTELLVKDNDKKSFDDQGMCELWKIPCLHLPIDTIFQEDLSKFKPEIKKFLKAIQQIAADCLNLLPTEVQFNTNLIELGIDSLQTTRFINLIKKMDLTAMGIQNEKFKKALLTLSTEDFLKVGTLLALYEYLKNNSAIYRKESDDRVNLIKRLPSKSPEKFMLTECRIYDQEVFGEIEETIWLVPSLLGNSYLDYGASKILHVPLKKHFLLPPENEINISNLDAMIDHFTNSIVVKRGVVFLAGWSSGGWIGKRIKQKLEQKSFKVFLFLLDAHHPQILQKMTLSEYTEELLHIAHKIRSGILCLLAFSESMQFNIPSLEELNKFDTKDTLAVYIFDQIRQSLRKLQGSYATLDVKAVVKCQALIEHAYFLLRAELEVGVGDLNESDIFIVADNSVKKYGKNLGWNLSENTQVEIIGNASHFDILYKPQLDEIIKRRIIKELTNLMEPYYQGVAYVISGKNKLAIDSFTEAALTNTVNFEDLYYYRGLAYLNIQNFEKALTDLTCFLRNNPNHINALISRGKALCNIEKYAEAAVDYSLICHLTTDPKILRGIAPFIYGILYSEYSANSQHDKSIESLRTVSLNNSILKSSHQCEEVSNKLNSGERITQEDQDNINKAIENDPENLYAYITRSRIKIALGEYSKARENLEKAVLLGAKKELLMFYFATIEFQQERYPQALEILNTVIEQDVSKRIEAYHLRGLSYSKLGQVDLAINDFTIVINTRNDTKSLMARGIIYENKKDFQSAFDDFVSAIKLGVNNMTIYYKAALTAKQIIKQFLDEYKDNSKEEIERIYGIYKQASVYLQNAIDSIGVTDTPFKTRIKEDLTTLKSALEKDIKAFMQKFGFFLRAVGDLRDKPNSPASMKNLSSNLFSGSQVKPNTRVVSSGVSTANMLGTPILSAGVGKPPGSFS